MNLKLSIAILLLFYGNLSLSEIKLQNSPLQLTDYKLKVVPDLTKEIVDVKAVFSLKNLGHKESLSIHLPASLEVEQVKLNDAPIDYIRATDKVIVALHNQAKLNTTTELEIQYSGQPQQATNPPWDGGFYYTLDRKDRSWLTTAPIKELSQAWLPSIPNLKADSSLVSITVRQHRMAISNGQLIDIEEHKERRKKTFTYRYPAPISPDELQLNIGYYATYDTSFLAFNGEQITISNYVQDYSLRRAQKHFQQLNQILTAWEHYLGPFPDTTQHLQVVEVPFPGNAATGIIQYGNNYMRGSYGGFIPRDMNWDHELVRSTAAHYVNHRFGKLRSADRWLKAAFATYLESLFVEFYYGKKKALEYLALYRPYIRERQPLVDSLASDFDLNDGEFQAKAALLLHSLRQLSNNDQEWVFFIRTFMMAPPQQNETQHFIDLFNQQTGYQWGSFIEQYLRDFRLPELQFSAERIAGRDYLRYKLKAQSPDFKIPLIDHGTPNDRTYLLPTDHWQTTKFLLERFAPSQLFDDPLLLISVDFQDKLTE